MPSIQQLLSLAAAILAASTHAAPLEAAGKQHTCPSKGGAMVLAARGSDGGSYVDPTQPNPAYRQLGNLRPVANDIANGIGKGSFVKALAYPAVVAGSSGYADSVNYGADQTHKDVTDFVNRCGPDSQVVLLGFSQGGQVMSQALSSIGKHADNIHAGAIFADATFVEGIEPLDVNTSSGSGVIANADIQNAVNSEFGQRVRSYCRVDDNVCSPTGSTEIHLTEPAYWHKKAVKFVLSQF